MPWHCIGNKTLPEPMITQLASTYMSLGLNELTESDLKNHYPHPVLPVSSQKYTGVKIHELMAQSKVL